MVKDSVNSRKNDPVPVKIVDTELEFPSYSACARYLRLSPNTVTRIVGLGLEYDGMRIELLD